MCWSMQAFQGHNKSVFLNWFTTMHLKPYPKPQDKEIHRESVHDGTRGLHADQQGVLRKEWGVHQECGLMGSSGNGTANRCPLSVISTNTLRCSSGSNAQTRVSGARKSRASSVTTFTSSLVLLSPSTGLENEGSFRIYQGEDAEGFLDIWAVIKPGNTKQKIAIFATQKCGSTCSSVIDNTSEKEAIVPELQTVSVKNKGCWDSDWSVAKRRRRSGNPDKSKSMETSPKTEILKVSQQETLNENVSPCKGVAEDAVRTEGEDEKTLSVVEMVAYLEQRVSDQQVSSKVPFLRSTSTITLSKVGTVPQPAEQQSKVAEKLEVQEEEGESVQVLDMVAKLESQCLSRQSLREGGGDLSRNNSIRRKVGRVLLAGSEPYSLPSQPVSPSVPQDCRVESVPQQLDSDLDKLSSPPKTLESIETSQCGLDTCALKEEESSCISRQETSTAVETVQSSPKDASSECSEEPIPGMLFFAKSSPQPLKEQHLPSPSKSRLQNKESSHIQYLEPSVDTSVSFREESRDGLVGDQNHPNLEETKGGETCLVSQEPVPIPLRRLVSHEFLEARFKIQLLLEPQQYMAFLPHHIIVKIFCLLPTESLAALKCTCHYFKFIIESYNVRPADSRWVSDPRYKDDPCKQCKKRYDRGDVSLCRWHHKPYCQALPYGPGYWMCCRRSHKDTPGCNVGLHDNRWVPAFHSINMPIYKKSRDTDEDL
ncbi:F-box only protein 34-like isoform X2 [Sinocyclocheilus anshuiensis]|uniref:F-box only protein 34-like isoform X1 n=1 Tax=Sinocyclocheilus anshuiensis TaxID=1608454 RepID=UPI0007B80075|nr:PREDICTED: F-box only protein 34-like isoform X1 [Sinocyclocheilus anshuiensis]XP_016342743.1 PREDICTED: F-box only protein 34-like isoform X2 [Sinocyclocheilus anshuiensis]XP_016342744.1 PREDICTED: F-box only protein 34-like isoform X2 [Sinocyclocheilus anshuiensis]